jgi:hypothetical protein
MGLDHFHETNFEKDILLLLYPLGTACRIQRFSQILEGPNLNIVTGQEVR